MNLREFQETVDREAAPHEVAVRKYKSLRSLGRAILNAWQDMGFGTGSLAFGDIVVPPSPKYAPYTTVHDPQLDPLTDEDIKDLMSIVSQRYREYMGGWNKLSYVRQGRDQLEITTGV